MIWRIAVSIALMFSCILPMFANSDNTVLVSAISADYPMQLINIAANDNSGVLTENGTTDNSSLSVKGIGNDLSPSWRFDYVGTDSKGAFFKIVNAQSGRILTPEGYGVRAGVNVVVFGSESDKTQHWYVVPVKNDRLGNGLYYKIVNYMDTSLAITRTSGGVSLSTFTGADNQLWLLNSDGLQGFAGYCKNDNTGSPKASTIGGLFGPVVEVQTFDELKKYATADEPYTIVVSNNISVYQLNQNGERFMCSAGRIYVKSNKTIIGSYGAHTLFNVQFCTSSNNGVGDNIIIKNFDMKHDAESNHNDSIVCYFGSGKNIWVDHVSFTGHSGYGYAPKTQQVDEDKFLACCYDADYCTVSDCSFWGHKYGLILGYPNDNEANKQKYGGYPRMSLISNKFDDCNTRGPGLMRWGYFHSLNNYVNKFNMAYTVISECNIFAENCVYENGGNVICDWDKTPYVGHYSETGSIFSNCKRTKQGGDSNSLATACSWRPSGNYSYSSLSASNAKNYCNSFSACQSSAGNIMYLRFGQKGVPSAGFTAAPSGPVKPSYAEFEDGSMFRFKNVNSGLYMQATDGVAANNTNIQQWSSEKNSASDIWKLKSVGNGFYVIYSCLGDSNTFALDVVGKKADNGTNIALYQSHEGTNQQYMFTQNSDGSYKILTAISNCKSAVEVIGADKTQGANVQQWEVNGANCQDWVFEEVSEIPVVTTTPVTTTTVTTTTTEATTTEATTTTVTTLPETTTTTEARPEEISGDVNSDGVLSAVDFVLFQQYMFGDISLDIEKADISGDGIINIIDFCLMKELILK